MTKRNIFWLIYGEYGILDYEWKIIAKAHKVIIR